MLGTLASTYRPIFVVPTSSDRPQSHPSTSNHPKSTKLHPYTLQHPFYPLTSKNPTFLPSVGVFLRSLCVSVVLWLCRPRSTLQNRRIRSNNRFIDDFCDLGALQSPYCSLVKTWPYLDRFSAVFDALCVVRTDSSSPSSSSNPLVDTCRRSPATAHSSSSVGSLVVGLALCGLVVALWLECVAFRRF